MHLLSARRQGSLLAVLCCIFLCTGCGQKNDPTPSAATAPETRAAIQTALIDDAGMEVEQFRILAMTEALPSVDSFDSVSLTLALLLASPGQLDASPDQLREDIAFQSDGPPNPAKIAETLMKNIQGSKCCVIAPDKIQELNCNVSGNEALGNVKFQFGDIFTANVQYRAEQKDGKWRIIDFKLPNWDIKLTRGENQRWVASGLGVERSPLRLPQVAALPGRDFKAPRFRVNIGLKPGIDKPTAAADMVVFEGKKITPLADFAKSFPAALHSFEKEHRTSAGQLALVLWVDRRMPFGPVEQFLFAAAGLGIKDFRLAAQSEAPLQEPNEMISLGEFRLHVPRLAAKDQPALEELPPLALRINANEDGKSRGLFFMDREIPVSKLLDFAKSLVGTDLKDEPLQIHVDPRLQYSELLQVLSALGELKDSAKPEIKTYAPLFKVVQLEDPTRDSKIDLTIDPKMIDAPESILNPNVTLDPDVNVAPTITAPDGVADPLSNLKGDPNTLELKIEGSSSGGSVTGGTGIGVGKGSEKPAPVKEPKK